MGRAHGARCTRSRLRGLAGARGWLGGLGRAHGAAGAGRRARAALRGLGGVGGRGAGAGRPREDGGVHQGGQVEGARRLGTARGGLAQVDNVREAGLNSHGGRHRRGAARGGGVANRLRLHDMEGALVHVGAQVHPQHAHDVAREAHWLAARRQHIKAGHGRRAVHNRGAQQLRVRIG